MKRIDSTKHVPLIYNTSRDFQAILRMLDILVNVEKSDIDNLPFLYNADICPNEYLPLLASYVGYDYDYSLPYESNRIIIRNYPDLIKNRGSKNGMLLACAVMLNISGIMVTASTINNYVNLVYVNNSNVVNIYISKVVMLPKFFELLEIVRPAGLGIIVHPSIAVRAYETIHAFDTVTLTSGEVADYNRDVISPNEIAEGDEPITNTIGLGQIATEESE